MGHALNRLAWLSLFIALFTGCATRQPILGQEVTGLDRKLSTHAWFERGDLVELVVDTRPCRDRDGQPYMPLEIAIVNLGQRRLALTHESFTLVDSEWNRYPLATERELIDGYEFLDFDRNLGEIEGLIFNRYATFRRYPSNFSPSRTFSGRSIVRDLVALPKFGYLIDFLYFPAPATGIRDQVFELFVSSPDLPDPVFVRFQVR